GGTPGHVPPTIACRGVESAAGGPVEGHRIAEPLQLACRKGLEVERVAGALAQRLRDGHGGRVGGVDQAGGQVDGLAVVVAVQGDNGAMGEANTYRLRRRIDQSESYVTRASGLIDDEHRLVADELDDAPTRIRDQFPDALFELAHGDRE